MIEIVKAFEELSSLIVVIVAYIFGKQILRAFGVIGRGYDIRKKQNHRW